VAFLSGWVPWAADLTAHSYLMDILVRQKWKPPIAGDDNAEPLKHDDPHRAVIDLCPGPDRTVR
jgi:hypothetical protein